nr:serine protease snake-like isoform X3 [Onthophagus taurus]
MTLKVKVFVLLVVTTFVLTQGREVGQSCTLKNGIEGICEAVQNCESAKKDLISKVTPVPCGFNSSTPIVCCEKQSLAKTPRISEKKCNEYRRLETFYEDKIIGGGVDANPKEFPHMSLLGYGKNASIEFQCGGSLISEQFVLTAAHCLESRELGPVKVVRIGDLDTATDKDDADPQEFLVINTYSHPNYTTDSFYNDIAILKLNKPVQITTYAKPACLQSEFEFKDRLTVTGWGALFYGGEMYNKLQKLDLMNLEKEKCLPTYKPQKKLLNGIETNSQICGGNPGKSVDTCQGDSGGPLQYLIQFNPPVHKIVGVTSFGIHCNLVPGIYTRVSKYISWIESIVWPNLN